MPVHRPTAVPKPELRAPLLLLHPEPGRGSRPAAPPAPVERGPAPVTMLTVATAAAVLIYVWRIQDIYTFLATLQAPILVSAVALLAYWVEPDPRCALDRLRHPVTKWAVVILVFVLASGPFSISRGLTFSFVFSDFSKTFLLMVLVAGSVRAFRDVERYALTFVVGGFVYAIYVHTQVAVGINGRLGDLIMYDANDLGALLVVTLPLTLYFVVRGRYAWLRAAALLALGLFIIVLIKTGSRGAFLGMLAVATYILLGFNGLAKRTRVLSVAGGAVLMLGFASDTYWDMMRTLLNPSEDYNWAENVEGGRRRLWARGAGYMLSNPIAGLGAGTYERAEGTISSIAHLQDYGIGVKWSSAHNSFVELGAEIGVIGLFAFLMILWRSYQTARAHAPAVHGERLSDEAVLGQAMAGSIVGFVVAGIFVSHAFLAYPFVLYGLIAGYAKVTHGAGVPPPRAAPPLPRRLGGARGAGLLPYASGSRGGQRAPARTEIFDPRG